MTLEHRSKVAPRRLRGAVAGLIQRSRGLHDAMADLEHRERCEQLAAAIPRARSPTPTLLRMTTAAPEPSAVPKPLAFRKTKRELQREREAMELERVAVKRQHREEPRAERICKASATKAATAARRPTKCARVLFATTCRQYLHRSRAARLAGRGHPRRRLLF